MAMARPPHETEEIRRGTGGTISPPPRLPVPLPPSHPVSPPAVPAPAPGVTPPPPVNGATPAPPPPRLPEVLPDPSRPKEPEEIVERFQERFQPPPTRQAEIVPAPDWEGPPITVEVPEMPALRPGGQEGQTAPPLPPPLVDAGPPADGIGSHPVGPPVPTEAKNGGSGGAGGGGPVWIGGGGGSAAPVALEPAAPAADAPTMRPELILASAAVGALLLVALGGGRSRAR